MTAIAIAADGMNTTASGGATCIASQHLATHLVAKAKICTRKTTRKTMHNLTYNPDAKQGLIYNESDADYRATGWLGSTAIKCYHTDPFGFKKRFIDRDPLWQQGSSKGLRIGSLVDSIIEGTANQRYAIIPPEHLTKSGAQSTGKAAREWESEMTASGLSVITREEMGMGEMLATQVLSAPLAKKLIDGAAKQSTGRVLHPTGVPIQSRADMYKPGEYIVDLKTTADANLDRWYWTCLKWGYFIQAGLYREVYHAFDESETRLPFYHIVVQTVFPYAVRVYELDPLHIDEGWEQAEAAIDGIAAGRFTTVQEEPYLLARPGSN